MDFLRQLDIFDPKKMAFPVIMIGVGGIGSITALVLAKMGVGEMTLIDPDRVEPHNLPNQFHRLSDTGRYKVEATKDIIEMFSDTSVTISAETFPDGISRKGIYVSGVDSMKSRKAIWDHIKDRKDIPLYIDGRLGGEVLKILTVRPLYRDDRKAYERTLFSDSEAAELPCTARNIMYNGSAIASLIASQIKKYINKENYYSEIDVCLKTLSLMAAKEIIQS